MKKLYDLSGEILISSAQTDMAYKFFLDLESKTRNHYHGFPHANASVRAKSPAQILRNMSKQLRKEIYKNHLLSSKAVFSLVFLILYVEFSFLDTITIYRYNR
ncbi:hypothetical protein D7X98_03760 [bacterium 1XD8-76]|nr:hypothetical protein D7X98_03760 [bacterium 1XD8-76]